MNASPTRQEKIFALTRNELVFLIDSPEWLEGVSEFFAKGGFNDLTDAELDQKYRISIEEGVEP